MNEIEQEEQMQIPKFETPPNTQVEAECVDGVTGMLANMIDNALKPKPLPPRPYRYHYSTIWKFFWNNIKEDVKRAIHV